MNFAIIISLKDPAGINIKERLIEKFEFKKNSSFDGNDVYEFGNAKLYSANEKSIHCEDIDRKIDADFFIFASKHAAKAGVPSLCVHTPGNWGKAEYGGKDNELCIAPASYLKAAVIKLDEMNNLGFEVIQECTHHGPYMEKPCMFIEIGCNEEQWKDKKAAEVIADVINYLTTTNIKKYNAAVGIGGLHHTPNFKKIIIDTDIAIGHVCPKYNLQNLTKDMLKQAIEKTDEKVELVILDWKGLGDHKEKIKEIVDEIDIEYKKTKEF